MYRFMGRAHADESMVSGVVVDRITKGMFCAYILGKRRPVFLSIELRL